MARTKNEEAAVPEAVQLRRKKGYGPHYTKDMTRIKAGEPYNCPVSELPNIDKARWDFPEATFDVAAPVPVVGMAIEHDEEEPEKFNVRNDDTGNLVNDAPLSLDEANALIKESRENK